MTTLQWTDLRGRTHVGTKDEVMAAAFLANRHHTITPVERDRQERHTMHEPITCTAPECDNYDRNLHGFGYDGVVDIHYCRACGSVSGTPFGDAPAQQPDEEVLNDEQLLVDLETFTGTWTKFDGEWHARIPVDDGVDVPPGSSVVLSRKNGATATVRAGETLRRFRNTAGSWFPFVAIVRVMQED